MYSYQSSSPLTPVVPSFSVQSVSIRQKSVNLNPSDILHNEIFNNNSAESRIGHTLHWLRGKSSTNSKKAFDESFANTNPDRIRKKHFLTGPYAVIFKGKKLRQRQGIGNVFRENVGFSSKNVVVRNEFNMRSKWK